MPKSKHRPADLPSLSNVVMIQSGNCLTSSYNQTLG